MSIIMLSNMYVPNAMCHSEAKSMKTYWRSVVVRDAKQNIMKKGRVNRIILLLITVLHGYSIGHAQKTYIVAVGLNHYQPDGSCIDLPCSVGDAFAISKFFNNTHNSDVFMLKNRNATRAHILKILKKQFAKATEKDQIIFAYSGHGFDGGISCYDNDGRGNTNIIFCSEIQDILRSSKARRKLMFINSCHSGSFAKKYSNDSRCRNFKPNSSDVMLYMSSRANEYSWEAEAMEKSFFFNRFIEGLSGKSDANGDRKITARELFNYVNQKVISDTGGRQHPQMYGRFSDDMVIVNLNR